MPIFSNQLLAQEGHIWSDLAAGRFLRRAVRPSSREGVRVHHHYSFPSGHTITAFGLFFCIALVNEKRSIAVLCLLSAAQAAYSRIYLAQHFLIDTLVGSLFGVLITGLIYWLAYVWQPFWRSRPLNRPMS